MKKKNLIKSVCLYSLFFGIIVSFILWIFARYRKGFVCVVDGLSQHFITLNYFKQLLEKLITTGELSTFTWNIGFGMDMFANLAYYIFGDPLSYLCVFVPEKYLHIFYYALIFLRMYLAGLAFIAYCRYKKVKPFATIIGALMYTFCAFILFYGFRHPYFINAMIYFPLLMIGIEKIILENKKIFYIFVIALTCISNFYFAYSMFLIIAIYGIILTIYTYKDEGIKSVIVKLLKTLGCSIIGIMISAIVLIPTAYGFLSSARVSDVGVSPYSMNYYRQLLMYMTTYNGGYGLYIGVHAIIFITLPMFIKNRKESYPLFLLLIMLSVPILVSKIGSIFCGFSYPNNRWASVLLVFLFSYMSVMFIDKNQKLDKRDFKCIVVFLLIYLAIIYILRISISLQFEVNMILVVTLLLVFYYKEKISSIFILKKINLYKIILMIIIILGLIFGIYYLYDIEGKNYISQYINFNSVNKRISTVNDEFRDLNKAITFIKEKDKGFYKIGKTSIDMENVSLIKDYNSISYYYSITPRYYQTLTKDLENAQRSVSIDIKEFDYRTKITTLLGNKYYIANNENIPYGYEEIDEYQGKSKIYKNNYDLPFAVLYTNYITQKEYQELNAIEKESSLLKTVALEEEAIERLDINHNENIMEDIRKNSIKNVEYEIKDKNKILNNNRIKVESTEDKKNQIKLKFDKIMNSEIYVYIENLEYEPYTKQEMIQKDLKKNSDKIEKNQMKNKYRWYQKNYKYTVTAKLKDRKVSEYTSDYKTSAYYIENKDFLMNMGYYNEEEGEISLTFEKVGNYTFDSIKIIAVPMNDYAGDIDNLRRSNFEVNEYSDGILKGNVNSKEAGVLQFSTLYSKGWNVYVDGQKVDTFISNNYFLGIYIEEGPHEIYMEYEVPYLNIGIITTIMGLTFFIILCFVEKKKKIK